MTNNLSKPQIRFKGFTEAWEQRKLGDIATIVGGGTPSTANESYWNGNINWFSPAELGEQNYVYESQNKITKEGLEHSSAKLLPIGTVLFTSRAGIGKTAILAEKACTNQGFQSIVPIKECLDSYFIYSCTNQLKKYGETKGAGSTFVEVSGKQMSEMLIKIPNQFDEQLIVGSFFKKLDSLITLHQRKYEKLQQIKKSLLAKMFPAEGDSTPKIRFKGFTEAWEQRKLGDISESYSGGTPTVGEKEYYDGNIPFIRSGEINSDKTELFLSENGLNNSSAKMVKIGDILYALYGATSGEVSISKLNGAINQAILVIQPHQNHNNYFLMQWLRKSKKMIIGTYLQGGQGNLSGNIVKELSIDLPFCDEQKLIGTFFNKLDSLITLHQRKRYVKLTKP